MAKLIATYYKYRWSNMLVEDIGNRLAVRPLTAATIKRKMRANLNQNGFADVKIESVEVMYSRPTQWEAH